MKARLLILLAAIGCVATVHGQGLLITEFKALNDGAVKDEYGFTPDWIELHNASNADLDLGGWFLTDDSVNLRQWAFPSTNLAAGRFLVVFASGRNQRIAGRPLHTSFQLRGSGEYLALVRPDGVTVAQAFGPLYPPQYSHLAYGYTMTGTGGPTGGPIYLLQSPGATNPPPAAPPPLALTEIMYNPAPTTNITVSELYEFIELKNTGTNTLNLKGMFFSAGVTFAFGSGELAPGERGVLVGNWQVFVSRYGSTGTFLGQFSGSLNDGGERLALIATNGATIFDFIYDDAWHRLTDGRGHSLVPVNEAVPPSAYGRRSSWRASGSRHGSPGQLDPPVPVPPVVINEVLTRAAAPFEDAVELFNPGPADLDISGWLLTDDFNEPAKFVMPAGAIVPAGGFLALDEHAFNAPNDDPLAAGFGLADFGEEIFLFSTDTNESRAGFVHGFEFGTAEPNVTFGRHVISTGEEHFVPQTEMTFLGLNAGPKLAAVVFTEVRPDPDGLAPAADDTDAFIELRNVSAQPVPLFDPQFPTNTWRLRDPDAATTTLDFPPGVVLPPGGYALVVAFDPTNTPLLLEFAAANGVTPGTPVFGPWPGGIGGSLELLRPDAPEPFFVPYLLVERLDYSPAAPWPVVSNGDCLSLHRLVEHAYGNDPTNWCAGQITPGLSAGFPAGIVPRLPNQTVHVGSTVVFDSTALGGTPTVYQWHFNGVAIAGASAGTLTLENIQPAGAGYYACYISNALAAGFSCIASLEVFDTNAPHILVTAPASIRARVTAAPFVFTGTATDDAQVSAVFVQHGEAAPVLAAGTNNWSAGIPLHSGLNTLRVFALDWVGNSSATNTVLVLLEPDPAHLGLLLYGDGTVSGASDGQSLRAGRRYTLRARPTPGHYFSHWLDWQTGLVSTNPIFTFTMSPNRTLAAHFAAGPFAGLVGGYSGLFDDPADPSHLNGGYFTLRVTGGGAYSGGLYYRGVSHALHGRFSEALAATHLINRSGTNDLLVNLGLTRDPVSVTGIVSEARFAAALTGRRSGFTADSGAVSNITGRYAITLTTDAAGTGVVSIAASGQFTLRARLPDRTPIVKSLLACENGDVPFYRTLYDGAGSAFGWVNLHDTTPASLSGYLIWTRTGSRGFTNQIQVLGERNPPIADGGIQVGTP